MNDTELESNENRPLSLLYVDKDILLLKGIKEFLEPLGFIVDTAESGFQAFQKISDKTYDAIISNYLIPGIDGITLLKKVRYRYPDLPVILFTGDGNEKVVIEAYENGVDFYILQEKNPSDQFNELSNKIRVAVQRRREGILLRESEYRYRSLIHQSSDLLLILNRQYVVLYASPSSLLITGFNPAELKGKSSDYLATSIFSQCSVEFMNAVQNAMKGDPVDNLEIEITKKDRTRAFVNMYAIPTVQNTILTGVQISMRDITRAKQNEIALKESEVKFRAFVEHSLDGTLVLDPIGNILFATHSAVKILDTQSPEEIIGRKNVMEFISPESQNDVINDFNTVANGVDGYIARYKIITGNQEERWVESIGKTIPFQDSSAILISFRDITERRKNEIEVIRKNEELQISLEELSGAEKKLKQQLKEICSAQLEIEERELQYQQLFEANDAGIALHEIVCDDAGSPINLKYININPAFEKITGLSEDSIIGKTVQVVFPGKETYWIGIYERVTLTGNPVHFEDIIPELGKYFEITAYSPKKGFLVTLFHDVSERKKYEIHLRETNAYLDNLISNANVPIIVWDPSFLITRMNHSCELLIGRLEQDVLQKPISVLFPPEQIDSSMRLIHTTLDGVRWDTLKINIQHQDGSIKTVIWNSSTIYGPDGCSPVATIAQGRDVTTEQLLQKEKETATSQIQENIAKLAILNDGIRNPLTLILFYIDQIPNTTIIDLIQSQIKNIDEMVSNLDKEWILSVKILEYLRKEGNLSNGYISSPSYQVREPERQHHDNNIRKTDLFLAEIQAQLYSILDSIDALIFVSDMESYEILFINNQVRNQFGDIIGQKCYKSIQKNMDDPCPFCTNHLLINEGRSTGVHMWEYQNSLNDRWYDCRDRAIRWSDERMVKLHIAADITERKRYEEELLKRNEELDAKTQFINVILETVPVGIFMVEVPSGRPLISNPAATRLLGRGILPDATEMTLSEVYGAYKQGTSNHYPTSEMPIVLGMKGESKYIDDMEVVHPDGSRILLEVFGTPFLDNNGNIIASIVSFLDISERKRNEMALQESEEKFRALVEQSLDGLIIIDISGNILFANRKIGEILRYPSGEEITGGSNFLTFIVPEFRESVTDYLGQVQSGIASTMVTYQISTYDGNVIWVESIGKEISYTHVPSLILSLHDITDRKYYEITNQAMVKSMGGTIGMNALDTITETLSSFLGADCVMIGEIQPDNTTVHVLSMILDGKPVKNYIYSLPKTPCENVHEKGYCEYCDNVQELFPDSKDLRELNIRGYLGTPLRNSNNKVIGILCLLFRKPIHFSASFREMIDIIAVKAAAEIERTEIEQRLRENQRLLTEAMELAHVGKWEYDIIADQFTFDEQFYRLYGTTPDREGGNNMSSEQYAREFVLPGDIDLVAVEVERAITTPDPDYTSYCEHRIVRRDGEIRTISVLIAITKDLEGKTIKTHGVNQDITDRKKGEDALRQANRQLSLLTGITRHDILNKVSLLYVYLESAKLKFKDSEIEDYLRKLEDTVLDIQSQIEFTRIYEELGSHEPQWISLHPLMSFSFVPASITMKIEGLEGISVYADPMVKKVFSNLLENSIRHGQKVTEIRVSSHESDSNLTVIWEDNGIGIAKEEKELIFDRGFGKNTGFGMFLAREILSLTGISICETGVPGVGVRFEIVVPRGMYRFVKDKNATK